MNKDKRYQEISNSIEKLYLEKEYRKIIDIKETNSDIDFLDNTGSSYCQFSEIFTVSYIEHSRFKYALAIINRYLDYLREKDLAKCDYQDDLDTFYWLKLEIHDKQNAPLKQLRAVENYIKDGGKDNEILALREKLQDVLFLRFVRLNKAIMILVFVIILLSILRVLSFGSTMLMSFTSIWVLWYLLNYIFHKKIKRIFLKVLVH